jgi:asparagine synthase (glutamine-hydrolysing)
VGDKIHKLADVIPEDTIGFYRHLITQWSEASSLVEGADPPDDSLYTATLRNRFPDDVSWMQYLDTITYLPDDILAKVDRASMAVALEVRVPLLDHRLVEMSWRLPHRFKLRRGTSKWLLRQIAYKHVPKELLERPKMGFGVPIDQWLRGPLKNWAADLLGPAALRQVGLLKPEPIAEKWAEHQAGARNWQQFLWNVLMFQAWHPNSKAGASFKHSPLSASRALEHAVKSRS